MFWTRALSVVLVVAAAAILVYPTPRRPEAVASPAAIAAQSPGEPIVAETAVLATAQAKRTLVGDFESFAAVATSPQVTVRAAPDSASEVELRLADKTEHGQPQTLLVQKELRVDDTTWYKVLLPVRPNGSTGWVTAAEVRVVGVPYQIQVSLSERRLDLFKNGTLQASYPVGIGRDSWPTPGGQFYLMELLQPPNPDGVYGTRAYVLNGYSNVFTEFNGGAGALGIHGTNNDATIGQEVSHGCIRLHNADIEALAAILPLGTPVRILA